MHRPPAATLIAGVAALLTLVGVPGAWHGAFSGVSYSTPAAAVVAIALLVGATLLFAAPTGPARWRLVAAIAALVPLKVATAGLAVPTGWHGTYTMVTPAPAKTAGFAWRLGYHPYRIDPVIAFDQVTFELQFLNDVHRYNGRTDTPPRRVSKAVRVQWTGWTHVEREGELRVAGTVGGTATAWLDGRPLPSTSLDGTLDASAPVAAGTHRIDVGYEKPAGMAPAAAVTVTVDGASTVVTPWRADGPGWPWLAGSASDGAVVLGAVLLVALAFGTMRGARLRGSTSAAGAVLSWLAMAWLAWQAVRLAGGFAGATYEFYPGDDHLAYEGLSRNILEQGLLMPEHRPIGAGTPFFFYPLYSYALAGMHLVFTSSHAAVVFLNALAAAALPGLLWLLGWRRLPGWVQAVGLALLLFVVDRYAARYFESPVTDNLFSPLAFAALVLGTRALRTLAAPAAFATGAVVALCAITRPSAFLFLVPFGVVLAWHADRWPRRIALAVALAAGYAAALAPVVLRNWIVAKQAVAMVTLSHAIPIALLPPEAPRPDWVTSPALMQWSSSLGIAWSLVVADPAGVAWLEVRKLLFAVGFTEFGPPGSVAIRLFPVLVAVGLVAVFRRRVPRATVVVLATFVATHLAAVVIAYPWTYGYKTILPVILIGLFAGLHLLARAAPDDEGAARQAPDPTPATVS